MNLTVELPDVVARQLRLDGPTAGRRTLEMLAVAAYSAGELGRGGVGKLLGLSFFETEEFLKLHGAFLHSSLEEVEEDTAAVEKLSRR